MRRALYVVVVVAVLAGAFDAADYQRGAALVIDAAGLQGFSSWISRLDRHRYTTSALRVASRHGPLIARVYVPADGVRRGMVLVPGVHAGGIDEPRLVAFSRDLAERGNAVLTVDLPDLRRYAITPRTTDMIEDAALWLSGRADLAPGGKIGVAGVSFGGGLAIVAAGRPSVRDRTAFALSLGGHADLPRTLRYLCTGRLPDGTFYAPHDYGVVVILLGVANRLVPREQVDALRRGILTFLEASHVDMVDKRRASEIFADARALAGQMPEPAATFMRYVNDRNAKALGTLVLPHVGELADDPALSAERSAPPRAPVYLLHGTGDNVIPSAESATLARVLGPQTEVHLLLSPLITHAEVDRPASVREIWKLVSFWTRVLDE